MKRKRIVAYMIDTVLITLVILFLTFILKNNNMQVLEEESQLLNQSFLSKEVGFSTYLNHYSSIMYDMDRNQMLIHFLSILIMTFYFVFLPYKWNGMTLGKKWMGIRINKEEGVDQVHYFLRAFLINGLGYFILSFLFVLFLPAFSYFLTISILGILQIILVITSLFMLLYSKRGKSLEDTLTGTEVIPIDEVKK